MNKQTTDWIEAKTKTQHLKMSFLLAFLVIYFQNSIINGVRESHEKSVTDVEKGNVREKKLPNDKLSWAIQAYLCNCRFSSPTNK